jgi:hypothetical protein
VAHDCNPTTQEAEIRQIVAQSQTGQIVHKTLSGGEKKKITKKGQWNVSNGKSTCLASKDQEDQKTNQS